MGQNFIESISLRKISLCFVLDKFSSKVARSPFGHNRLLLSKLLNRTGPAPFFFGLEVQTKVLNKIVNNGLHLLDPSHSSLVLNKVHTNSRQSCRCSPVMYDPQDITWDQLIMTLINYEYENDKPCSPSPPSRWALAKRERWWVISWSDLHCFPFVWFWSSSFICIFILLLPQLQKWHFEV